MSATKTSTGRLSAEKTLALWREYKRSGDPALRDRLILTFAPMVKYIVYRKAREIPSRCDIEDFISCGLEALIRSVDRFDPEKGCSLEQFAWTRIHGAVLDELRRGDWAPRSVRRWERDINRARDQFTGLYGRPPSRAELAESLGVTVSELLTRQAEIGRSDLSSLNTIVLSDEESSIERIDTIAGTDPELDPERSAMRDTAKTTFREAFNRLPERDRKVAILLYVNHLTLREIGQILGVTESRVCQIHSQLKRHLREQLHADESLLAEVA